MRKTAKVFSSKRNHLIARYAKKWVGVYDGKVVAEGRSLREVLARVEKAGIPRELVMTRYIDLNVRKMVL